jgi:hypothetical protein
MTILSKMVKNLALLLIGTPQVLGYRLNNHWQGIARSPNVA